jgi:hypothetical protein
MNETGNEISIPSLKIDGKSVTGKSFTIHSVAASSLGSFDVSEGSIQTTSVLLKPYSVNVVVF